MTTLTAATPTVGGGMVPSQAPRPAVAAQMGGMTGADVLRILRHRLVLIIVLWVVFAGLTVGFTLFMVKYFPKYTASALVRVRSNAPINVLNPLELQRIQQKEVELIVKNQSVIVMSPVVLASVLKDPDIKQTKWYIWAREQEDEHPLDLLEEIVYASPIRDSNFLRVGVTWRYQGEVHTIANTVVDKYLDRVQKLQRDNIRISSDPLEKEVESARTLFNDKQREIAALRMEGNLFFEGGQTEELLTLKALLTELEVETLGRQSYWEYLQDKRPGNLPITADLKALLDSDPMVANLEAQLQDAEQMLALVLSKYGKNHPSAKDAVISRDALRARASEERSTKLLRYQQDQIEQARRNYLEANEQLWRLQERASEAEAEQRDLDAKYARYLSLVEERDLLRTQYEALLEQQKVLSMTIRLPNTAQIDIVSKAVGPKERSSPVLLVWLPAGTFLGLALSVGLAFLLELSDKSVRTPRDVSLVPVLGLIPTSDDDEIEIDRVETASLDAPHSILAEAFRNLRANLFFSAPAEQQGVILVVSPSGGDGKTTVATNLAISVALSGRRVLLIDANFRRAGLPKIFPDMPEEGLSNILIGQGRLGDHVTSTSVPGLDVLGAGPTPPNPAELLGSSYLRDVVVDARSQYDQVIVDGPPVLLVSDAMVLAGAVDGVLIVCRYRVTSRGALQRAQRQLEGVSARVFGAILNQVQTRAGGYFRKAYREFYEYQEPEEGPGGARPRLDVSAKASKLQATVPTGSAVDEGGSDAVRKGGELESVSSEDDPAGGRVAGAGPARSDETTEQVDGGGALGGDFDLDDEFKIDDDFDLGEDFGESGEGTGDEKPDNE